MIQQHQAEWMPSHCSKNTKAERMPSHCSKNTKAKRMPYLKKLSPSWMPEYQKPKKMQIIFESYMTV